MVQQKNEEKVKDKNYKSGPISDNVLIIGHIIFIIFSFVFAYQAPFYLGFLLIILHKSHELYFGECYLTLLQQKYNYSEAEDDFFYHLFQRLNLKPKRSFTRNIHRAIKTIILLIVLFNMLKYYLN